MKHLLFVVLSACVLTIPAPARAEDEGRIQILLLGDSTAEGSVPRRIRPEGPHLETVLEQLLAAEDGVPPCHVINSSQSGEYIRRLFDSGRYDRDAANLPGLDFILIRYGINDRARRENFTKTFPMDFHELLTRLRKDHPDAKLIPMTVIPFSGEKTSKEINDLVRQVAEKEDLPVFDIYPRYAAELEKGFNMLNYRRYPLEKIPAKYHDLVKPFVHGPSVEVMGNELDGILGHLPNWTGDRHPNLAGYNVIADETAKYLAAMLRGVKVKSSEPVKEDSTKKAEAVSVLTEPSGILFADDPARQVAPAPLERQLPFEMHSQMAQLPRITVGRENSTLIGDDNRVLQAAVDYIAALGGGTVEIGPGEFLMRDSLHLRPNVTVRGTNGKTVLRKADGAESPLAMDGDFGEQQFTVRDPTGFDVGSGVAIRDDNAQGFHVTVARITGRRGNTFSIDKPLMADCMASRNARAATIFPVVSGYDLRNVRVEGLIIEGNKHSNGHLNGCRGAGIFLYRGFGTTISECTVRNYNGDGISFQQSNDVTVKHCISEENAYLGFHPGSGSQRPKVQHCTARNNGSDGLYLCWRVRHGLFEDNVLEGNGQFGISIGHKDSDNLLQRNHVLKNGRDGVFFRNESFGMAAHRNRLKQNVIENNGTKQPAAGIRIRGETEGLIFEDNTIRDTRDDASQTQTIGVLIEENVGEISLNDNKIEAQKPIDDQRNRAGE